MGKKSRKPGGDKREKSGFDENGIEESKIAEAQQRMTELGLDRSAMATTTRRSARYPNRVAATPRRLRGRFVGRGFCLCLADDPRRGRGVDATKPIEIE